MEETYRKHRRKQIAELRHVTDIDIQAFKDYANNLPTQIDGVWVSISDEDRKNGSPKIGDMIARNPKNHNDQWLVAKQYYEDNFEPVTAKTEQETEIEEEKYRAFNNANFDKCNHADSTVRYGIKQCADCGKPLSNEHPKRVSAEESFENHFDIFRNEPYLSSLDSWVRTGKLSGSLLNAVREFASQHPIENKLGDIYQKCYQCGNELPKQLHCTECGNNFPYFSNEFASQHPIKQEKPSEQPQEEHTIDEEKILTLFAKHSNCLGKSPVRLPCMTRSAFVMAIREYAGQKHPVTDNMISAKLDEVNFETSKERETAFDLLVWIRNKLNNKET